jgi:hypothetical protein
MACGSNGSGKRSHGILRNPLYSGKQIWNRVRMVKNPSTGKRLSRVNSEAEWQTVDTRSLRRGLVGTSCPPTMNFRGRLIAPRPGTATLDFCDRGATAQQPKKMMQGWVIVMAMPACKARQLHGRTARRDIAIDYTRMGDPCARSIDQTYRTPKCDEPDDGVAIGVGLYNGWKNSRSVKLCDKEILELWPGSRLPNRKRSRRRSSHEIAD